MADVNLLVAFLAGVLALLSPCSAMLLPSFFAYAFTSPGQLVRRTAAFYVGLALTLVPLGTGAAAVSWLFHGHRATLVLVAGWALVVIGVYQALGGSFALPGAARMQAWSAQRRGQGVLGIVLLGAVYGLAGFCSGPVLGAILTVAATRETPVEGGLLLAVYALGMATPLFVLAALWDRLGLAQRSWLRGRELTLGPIRTHTTSLVAGLLFVAVGLLFLRYDGMAGLPLPAGMTDLEHDVQSWLTDTAGAVPLWALALVVAVVAAGYGVVRDLRRRHVERDQRLSGGLDQRQAHGRRAGPRGARAPRGRREP